MNGNNICKEKAMLLILAVFFFFLKKDKKLGHISGVFIIFCITLFAKKITNCNEYI